MLNKDSSLIARQYLRQSRKLQLTSLKLGVEARFMPMKLSTVKR